MRLDVDYLVGRRAAIVDPHFPEEGVITSTYTTAAGLWLEIRVDDRYLRMYDDGLRDVPLDGVTLYPERGDDPITIFLETMLTTVLIGTARDPHGRVIHVEFDAAHRPVVYDTPRPVRGGPIL